MAKANRTTSTPRRATAAKPTKARRRPPVEWGHDEKGRLIVVRASGWHARQLVPIERFRSLRNTINDMDQVVRAFDGTCGIADAGQRLTMLSMAATVARALMLDAEGHMDAMLAQWPTMRRAISKVDARIGKGGAA